MLLCKIMLNLPDDVAALVDGKMASKYGGRDVGAMKAVAEAHEKRDLQAFEEALRAYKEGEWTALRLANEGDKEAHADARWHTELSNDPIIRTHLAALYDTLLEQNLLRLIEPYSRVQIDHVAGLVRQPVREVEQK